MISHDDVEPGDLVEWYNPLAHKTITALVLEKPWVSGDYWVFEAQANGEKFVKELTDRVNIIKKGRRD